MASQDVNLTTEDEATAQNPPPKKSKYKEKILKALKNPMTVMKLLLMIVLLIVGNAVLFMSLKLVSLRNEEETALGIEIGTQ
ncbi:5627_t:CDS:1, partial [Acaulospora colombiana]